MLAALLLACAPALAPRSADAAAVTAAFAPGPRPRLVHLWASWCTPCIAELPRLLPALRARQSWLDVVLISLDDEKGAAAAADLLAGSGGAPGQSLRASAADALAPVRQFDAQWDGSLPATYLVSPAGRLLLAQRGLTELDALLTAADRSAPARKTARRGKR